MQVHYRPCTRDVLIRLSQLKLVTSRSWTNLIELCSRSRKPNRTFTRISSTARTRTSTDLIPARVAAPTLILFLV